VGGQKSTQGVFVAYLNSLISHIIAYFILHDEQYFLLYLSLLGKEVHKGTGKKDK